jgi:hypothetical protein
VLQHSNCARHLHASGIHPYQDDVRRSVTARVFPQLRSCSNACRILFWIATASVLGHGRCTIVACRPIMKGSILVIRAPITRATEEHIAMRADDAQPVPTELLGPARAGEESHIAVSLGEPGAPQRTPQLILWTETVVKRCQRSSPPWASMANSASSGVATSATLYVLFISMCLPFAFQFGSTQACHCRVDAALNLFLFPSIREYMECSFQASRRLLRNA